MHHPVKGIDHCFALVNDLDGAAAQYAALGFTLSPRGTHSEAKGTANYTIMFPDDYFELLGIVQPTDLNAPRRAILAEKGEGLHAIACRINDAAKAAETLTALGLETEGLGSFSRPVRLPNGTEGIAAFSTLTFRPQETPLGTVFMCQHKTRETVWVPELLNHPNTACGLEAILAISDTPKEDALRFARLWADGAVSEIDGSYQVFTGPQSAPLILCTAEDMALRYPSADLAATAKGAFTALRVKVVDIERVRDCLISSKVPLIETSNGLYVRPEFSAGVLMEFVPA